MCIHIAAGDFMLPLVIVVGAVVGGHFLNGFFSFEGCDVIFMVIAEFNKKRSVLCVVGRLLGG